MNDPATDFMKLLKYLLPVVVFAVFSYSTDVSVPETMEDFLREYAVEAASQDSVSPAETELCLPRQISVANTLRVQNTARRTNCSFRTGIEFTKSGKVINAGLRYFIQRNSILTYSSMTEPSSILLSLGRLII